MNSITETIKRVALAGLIPVMLTSCLKNNPFPLYGNKASAVINYSYAATADTLQEKTYTTFLSSNGNYFINNNAGNTTYNYWPQAHTMDVFIDGYLRTKNDIYKQRIKSLLNGTKIANGNKLQNDYYDDMEWLALSTLRAYEATNDADYFAAANTLWTDIKTGVNSSQGGGIAWRKSQLDYKNTPANAPAIIFAARLYRLQKNAADLALAKELYTWLKGKLVDPVSGIVWDGINGDHDGQISKNKFTYNQGVFIGAALELYNVTGDGTYLSDAIRTANATIKDLDISPGGLLKSEGQGDGGLFKGILVRYLTLLTLKEDVSSTDREAYAKFLKYNAETLFAKGISRPEFTVSPDWKTKPSGTTDLTTQISGVTTMEAAAILKAAGKF
ncbi:MULTISPECIES: glycoside hydrolase family 76 protein [unclassified Mucilaginibacter]|uniref:glycoside hydrolase family 76 protein n=1 Tax=unclassified Mucilaginibacter TaxID=2617802 RepID=UPI002AC93BAE|nr:MULTISPECIES: glycoside hydrolase family 76 protein [unclassified Mucilaginibacter]MEB0262103.1 glycoside hydrolase family 76 protein [Mucilaginibacter sp. 10I4]MEB0278787.1 glycoside hydrolase family 76 protein [Mucilaginibacter sp. 10B2]MEB0299848.1 glycoside hydrolase family 76 protein [Mucilaginibacter sp. 5C4]WPX21970.1 glycoside hydrolase family 76 protein [Mucilaginibacter sp. 5C4]